MESSRAGGTQDAGWFTDPWDSTGLRWWDGTTWTPYSQPQPPPPSQLASGWHPVNNGEYAYGDSRAWSNTTRPQQAATRMDGLLKGSLSNQISKAVVAAIAVAFLIIVGLSIYDSQHQKSQLEDAARQWSCELDPSSC